MNVPYDGPPGNEPQPAPTVELIAEPAGKKFRITAKLGDEVLHLHTFDPADDTQRARFIRSIRTKCPDVSAEQIDAELVRIATRPPADDPPPSAPAQSAPALAEVDVRRVARPELFHTPEVSGLTVAVVMTDGVTLTSCWRTYLRWTDGRREETAGPGPLALSGGATLFIHPDPGPPPGNDPPAWSPDSRRGWLNGHPAPDPAGLFWRLSDRIAKFLDFPPETGPGYIATLALWTVLTYVYAAWDAVPYLFVGGPMGSGKSRLLDVLDRLVFRPLTTANLTAAALFRTLHGRGGTVIYDEAERLRQATPDVQEVTTMFLAGYRRGGAAIRLEPDGDTFRPVQFDVYGPKALACIAGLPPTLASRCIPIMMFRAGDESPKPKLRLDADPAGWAELRDDLHVLALEHGPAWVGLAGREDVVPAGLSGRNYELWQPLLALAAWVESHGANGLLRFLQHHALATAEGAKDEAVPEADETLLELLAEAIRGGRQPTPGELLEAAKQRDEATFKNWHPAGVTRKLKAYGIPVSKKSNGRRQYRDVTADMLRRIQQRYGIDLGFPEPGAGGPTLSDPVEF